VIVRKGNSRTEMPNQFKSAQGSSWFNSQSPGGGGGAAATAAAQNSTRAFTFERAYAPMGAVPNLSEIPGDTPADGSPPAADSPQHSRFSGSPLAADSPVITAYGSMRGTAYDTGVTSRHGSIAQGSLSLSSYRNSVSPTGASMYGSDFNSPNSQLSQPTQRSPGSISDITDRFSTVSAASPTPSRFSTPAVPSENTQELFNGAFPEGTTSPDDDSIGQFVGEIAESMARVEATQHPSTEAPSDADAPAGEGGAGVGGSGAGADDAQGEPPAQAPPDAASEAAEITGNDGGGGAPPPPAGGGGAGEGPPGGSPPADADGGAAAAAAEDSDGDEGEVNEDEEPRISSQIDLVLRENDERLNEGDVFLNRIASNVLPPDSFGVTQDQFDASVASLAPRIVRGAKAFIKPYVTNYFAYIKTATGLAKDHADLISLGSKILAAIQDRECKVKYPTIPRHVRVVVPSVNCFDDTKKLETNNLLQSIQWVLQLDVLKATKECCRINLLTVDREMAKIPLELVTAVKARTFGFPAEAREDFLYIAKYEYDSVLANTKLSMAYEKAEQREAKQKKALQIAESKRKAELNLVAKASEKYGVLGNVINTELDLREAAAASDESEITRLQGNRDRQNVQLEKSLTKHLNMPNSKPRVGNKRKNGPGQQAQHQKMQKSKKAAKFTVSHGGTKMTVTPAGGGNQQKKQKKKKAKGKRNGQKSG
jgi:hypothetical protein